MNEQDTPRDDSQMPTASGNDAGTDEADVSSERRDRHQQQHARRRHPRGGSGNRDSQPRQENRSSSSVASAINLNELREVVELISQHGFTDFEFEREGFRVRLRKEVETQQSSNIQFAPPPAFAPSSSVAPPVAPPTSTPTTQAEANSQIASSVSAASPDTDLQIITSPIVGTFYRAASPTSEPFVKVGDTVESSTTVCIVEAMKLMNEIPAETSGTIEKIYVENAQPVEYGQPLFGVKK